MARLRATGRQSIKNVNDVIVSDTAPGNPQRGTSWTDTSKTPPVTKVWDGKGWVDKLAEVETIVTEHTETFKEHYAKIISNESSIDLRVTQQEYSAYKTQVDATIRTLDSSLKTAESSISVLQGQIALKVEQTDIDTAISMVDGKFASYSTTNQMTAAITAARDNITSVVSQIYATKTEVSTVSGKVSSLETWKTEASEKITADGIIKTVGNYYAYESDLAVAESQLRAVETMAIQTADKFTWLVKSGTSSSNFLITDRMAELTAAYINLHGVINITGLSGAAMDSITKGGLKVTEENPVIAAVDTGAVMQTDAGADIWLTGTSILHFANPEGGSGWGYFNGTKIEIPTITANLYKDAVKRSNGYIVYRQGGKAYAVWLENQSWKGMEAEGGPVSSWTWQPSKDAVVAEYAKKEDATVEYSLCSPLKTYKEARMSAMISEWAYGAISETTTINGGLIQTHTIVADKLATDAIRSLNYKEGSMGSFLNLADGSFKSPYLRWDAFGHLTAENGTFNGTINAVNGGKIGDFSIVNGGISSSPNDRGEYVVLSPKLFEVTTYDESGGKTEGVRIEEGYMSLWGHETDLVEMRSHRIQASRVKEGQTSAIYSYMEPDNIFTTGTVYALTVTQTSDERMKIIFPWAAEVQDEVLMSVEPISFRWVESMEKIHFGISAQRTRATLRFYGIEDAGMVLYDRERDQYSVAYSELHALEINSIQKNRGLIENHEGRIRENEEIVRKILLEIDRMKSDKIIEDAERMSAAALLQQVLERVAKMEETIQQAMA